MEIPPTLTSLTVYLLSRVGRTARAQMAGRLAAGGLRLTHMAVLAALADFGPHVQRDLAARLGIDPSDLVKVVDELAAAGHAERARDPADRRRVRVTLTPAGRTALGALTALAGEAEEAVLAPLTPDERALLHDMLGRCFAASPGGAG